MRICVVPSDKGGCGQYRMRWVAQALIDQGHDEVVLSDREEADKLRADEFDVVVLQRPLRIQMLAHIQNLQAAGIKVVVDIDDDFGAISPQNIAFDELHPTISPESNWNHLAAACRIADRVTVTTQALANRYGSHGRVTVLPNCVPSWYLDIEKKPNDSVTVGWTGAVQTHPGDLEATRGALNQIPAHFRVVGTGQGVCERLGIREAEATGWVEIDGEYQRAMASIDVGIVPLASSAFNQAKSWLKGLEFASLGVPFVASDTAEYSRLSTLGAGLIARKPKHWVAHLRRLTTDEDYRIELAEKGREVAKQLTIEGNAWRWLETWKCA